ncbi:hypothetical protein AYL99_01518 [Fonsecaea erecta]|uniref:Uncharacterized protein n=1 Tax=Fonsecaea erecta TaxID=1367422 RepID=A0A179A203_9EURO|nr:hypothetical protein AYL99_01518 [Fonsecaea erecta]OAP65546.1 hypothetical protein AYL99_01518 [Fonsecaea erecta]
MAVTSADDLPTDVHQHVGFVSVGPVRSTIELVWGCVFTIIICTWNIQHLTIASPYKSAWRGMTRKIGWALFTIIAPEYVSIQAINEYVGARIQNREMRDLGLRWWTTKHSFFGNIGGYLLEYQNEGQIIVRFPEIEWLVTEKLLVLPEIAGWEIDGLAREDGFRKAVAVVQLIWFALQCIGRTVEGMESALFEVVTLCFVTCTIVTLIFWWKKPAGVAIRRKISCPSISGEDIDRMLERTHGDRFKLIQELQLRQKDNADDHMNQYWIGIVFFLAGAVGVWHLAAWNYSFPSSVERILWRASSITTVILPIIFFFTIIAEGKFDSLPLWIVVSFLMCTYIVARTYLVVETIISLRSAPSGIYERVRWSEFIPHV